MATSPSSDEFSLIRDFLANIGPKRSDVSVDIGDDCSILRVPTGVEVAVSVDTLVAGVHFFSDCDPASLGHKALAVSLSDLAAVGAQPAWATLALTLPKPDARWLQGFAEGMNLLAMEHGLRVIGGDLTRGPLSISVQVIGLVETGQGILRSGARLGDILCVSGELGDAGLALRSLQRAASCQSAVCHLEPQTRDRLERPTPRVALGIGLRGIASSAIDISDGFLADLGHLLSASDCGAEISLARLPLSPAVRAAVNQDKDWHLPLTSGDDYELCFTVPQNRLGAALALADQVACRITAIGSMTESAGVCVISDAAEFGLVTAELMNSPGFNHFRLP